jgi:hypothetical protein
MNKSILGPNQNENILATGNENSFDGQTIQGLVVGKNNQINGFSSAYVLGNNNQLVTAYTNSTSYYNTNPTMTVKQTPSMFVVGNNHKFGRHGWNFLQPLSQVLISPATPYKFVDGSGTGGNLILDAGTPTFSLASRIVGGQNNIILTTKSLSSGFSPTQFAAGTVVVIGGSATASYGSGTVTIGNDATNTNTNGVVVGTNSAASSSFTTVVGTFCTAHHAGAASFGNCAAAAHPGSINFSTGYAASVGDLGYVIAPHYIQTTDATLTNMRVSSGLGSPAASDMLTVNNTVMMFDVDVTARLNSTTPGQFAAWNIKFVCQRDTTNASVAIHALVITPIHKSTGADTWNVNVIADTTNGRPVFQVTGEAAKTIRWYGIAKYTKLTTA